MPDEPTTVKWRSIREMWGGLGLFLVIVLVIVVTRIGDHEDHERDVERIRACQYAQQVERCLRQVDH